MTEIPEHSGLPTPRPTVSAAPLPARPEGVDQRATDKGIPVHSDVSTTLEALAQDLPALRLGEHHDRYVAVLELLHEVLDGAPR